MELPDSFYEMNEADVARALSSLQSQAKAVTEFDAAAAKKAELLDSMKRVRSTICGGLPSFADVVFSL